MSIWEKLGSLLHISVTDAISFDRENFSIDKAKRISGHLVEVAKSSVDVSSDNDMVIKQRVVNDYPHAKEFIENARPSDYIIFVTRISSKDMKHAHVAVSLECKSEIEGPMRFGVPLSEVEYSHLTNLCNENMGKCEVYGSIDFTGEELAEISEIIQKRINGG